MKENYMKTTKEIIEQLIEDDLDRFDTEQLYYILRDGFVGYRNQTHAELIAELESREMV
jgi:hypothetical protein